MEQTFFAYHTISDRPMPPELCLDETHPNGVYARVEAQRETVEEILRNPEKYRGTDLPYPVKVALRELALEKVRREYYPFYPSRLGCLYVSHSLQEARQWAEYFTRLNRPVFGVIKLQITGTFFSGDATKCFDGTADEAENLRMAKRYWENKDNPEGQPPIVELLAAGKMKIVEEDPQWKR